MLAWGKKVSPEFRKKVLAVAKNLGVDAGYLMACMAFESGRTFSPSVKNAAGSGAVGLIQFTSDTAKGLETTTEKLAAMSAVEQLDYVEKYFKPRAGKLKTIEDLYMAILWPAAVGKPLEYVLFDKNDPKHPKYYIQNKGLDLNKDGLVTKGEAASKVVEMFQLGMTAANASD